MPAALPYATRRLHLTINAADYDWLCAHLQPGETFSDLFRQIIRKLKGEQSRRPRQSILEILGEMDLKRESTSL